MCVYILDTCLSVYTEASPSLERNPPVGLDREKEGKKEPSSSWAVSQSTGGKQKDTSVEKGRKSLERRRGSVGQKTRRGVSNLLRTKRTQHSNTRKRLRKKAWLLVSLSFSLSLWSIFPILPS